MPKKVLLAGCSDEVLDILIKAPRLANVIVAREGWQAIHLVQSALPDAVIIGSELVSMSESEFVSQMRSIPLREPVPMMWVGSKPEIASLPGAKRWGEDHTFIPETADAAILPVLAYIRERVSMAYYAPATVWRG